MKNIKGVIVCLFVLLVGVVSVNAKTLTVDEIVEKAKEVSPDKDITYSISGDYITINSPLLGASLVVKFKDNILTYSPDTIGDNDSLILKYVLESVSNLQGFTETGDDIVEKITNYTYAKCGVEGTSSDGSTINKLTVDINKFNLNCNNSSSKPATTTPDKTTVDNPKTGVFVPVAGLSILIVASVVCLIWISKKSFRL